MILRWTQSAWGAGVRGFESHPPTDQAEYWQYACMHIVILSGAPIANMLGQNIQTTLMFWVVSRVVELCNSLYLLK